MEFGSTDIDAVGDAGGGGGGGGGGAAFFLQAPSIITAPSATTRANHFMRWCFTLFLPNGPRMIALRGPDEVYLFPTPVWLCVTSSKCKLLNFRSIGQHRPDFFLA